MAGSTLDPDNVPSGQRTKPAGRDTRALGPSDSSDSGSDVAGADSLLGDIDLDAGSDRFGTGERMAADREPAREDADRDTDRVVADTEAGLGGGLDQAEEARRRADRPSEDDDQQEG